jgi:hypothetical protein
MLPSNEGLTTLDRLFIEKYFENDFDEYRAGIACGMSNAVAKVKPFQILAKEAVKFEIEGISKLISEDFRNNTVKTLKKLNSIASSDPRRLFDKEGNIKPLEQLDDETANAVASMEFKMDITTGKHYLKSVKFWDKLAALTAIAKHQRIMTDTGTGVNITINAEEIDKPDNAGQTSG